MQGENDMTPEVTTTDSVKRKKGRPIGSGSRSRQTEQELVKDLVDTKCRLLKFAVEKLKDRLLESDNAEDRQKILQIIDSLVEQVEAEL